MTNRYKSIQRIRASMQKWTVDCPWCKQTGARPTGETVKQSRRGPLYEVSCRECSRTWFKRTDRTSTPWKLLEGLLILEDGRTPLRWEDWQVSLAWEPVYDVLDRSGARIFRTALLGFCKKHGKSSMGAACAVNALHLDGHDEAEIIIASNSREQSQSVTFKKVCDFHRRSKDLREKVNIYRDVVELKDGNGLIRAVSCNADALHGMNSTLTVFDELWGQPDARMLEALSESPTRIEPLTLVTSYAGPRQGVGPLWDLYELGKSGEDDSLYSVWRTDTLASWITPEYLARQRKLLSHTAYERLHENKWPTGDAETFITTEELNNAIDPALGIPDPAKRGAFFVGLDIGITKDRSAVAVAHCDASGTAVVDEVHVLSGSRVRRVSLSQVTELIEDSVRNYSRVVKVSADPYQAEHITQMLEGGRAAIQVERFTFTQNSKAMLANELLTRFRNSSIRIPDHPALVKELQELRIVLQSNGQPKFDHLSTGHDDAVTAVALAVNAASEHYRTARQRRGGVHSVKILRAREKASA